VREHEQNATVSVRVMAFLLLGSLPTTTNQK
jgi:hypothetical protein